MYTQCSHCKAIFRVTMKELTAAQGLLRCGECDNIFDAMKALNTVIPGDDELPPPEAVMGDANGSDVRLLSDKSIHEQHWSQQQYRKNKSKSRALMMMAVIALSILLLLQLAYSARSWLAEQPFAISISQQFCKVLDCKVKTPRETDAIKMLSHNVYSHPNTENILIISSSIQNNANFEQPFPLLEISFLNEASEVVALRRFTPDEYLKPELASTLMPVGSAIEFNVNIADPGQDAVRFQFRFL